MSKEGVVRFCFGATFAIAAFSLGLQFVQDWLGVWDDPGTVEPSHAVRIWRFFSYFTTQANLLVIATSLSLTVRADRDGSGWRVARLDALAGITITGLVHWFLLHPLDDFHGWLWASDTLVHILDLGQTSPAVVALYCVAILILLLVVSCLFWMGDRWLPGRMPREPRAMSRAGRACPAVETTRWP